MKRLILLFVLLPALVFGQGIPIKGGATNDLANVNANKALEVVDGRSARPTYVASVGAQATTAAIVLSVESSALVGFKLVQLCVGITNATAAAGVTVTVQRRTTASSGGTALTAEGTGTASISKLDPADGNWPGVARVGGTPGTAGAILDQQGFQVGELGAGTADTHSLPPWCKMYGGATGEKPITVLPGVTNGLTVTLGAAGTGGLAFGSISATIVAE
jgi:hypothetical protein